MKLTTDQKGNMFSEFPMKKWGKVRITLVKQSWWDKEPAIRIQIRKMDGRLHMGPAIPIQFVEETLKAIKYLKRKNK